MADQETDQPVEEQTGRPIRIAVTVPRPSIPPHRVTHAPHTFLQPIYHDTYAEGAPLYEEHVVRAANGLFYSDEDRARFDTINLAHCPTFGNCKCFRAGPVGDPCMQCTDTDSIFTIIGFDWNGLVMDAEGLARLVGHRYVQWPVGARHFSWETTPFERFPKRDLVPMVAAAIVQLRCPPEANVPPVEREPIRREATERVEAYFDRLHQEHRIMYPVADSDDSDANDDGNEE